MIDRMEGPYGPYANEYRGFFESAGRYRGYHFGGGPGTSVPPPTKMFARPLTWWSLDRPQRLRAIRAVRDRFQMDILRLNRRAKVVDQGSEASERMRRDVENPVNRHRRGVSALRQHASTRHHDQRAA